MTGGADWDYRRATAPSLPPGPAGIRECTHAAALNEALRQLMAADESVFVMGQGVDDPLSMFGVTSGLAGTFGNRRVFDTPLAEEAMTGIAVGAALAGMRPIHMHNRPDFLLVAMNQIANHAAKWRYMTGGRCQVPLVIWACTGRGWGAGAQHSQTLHGLFQHIPGLKVVVPTAPADAKGLLVTAVRDNNPVLIIEHRWLLRQQGQVPADLYAIPFGKGVIRRPGRDVTIVAISQMVSEALLAADLLAADGCEAEVIDPRTLVPLDRELILASTARTGRLLVADNDWLTGGAAAEITALVAEHGFHSLKAPPRRIGFPPTPCPSGPVLEQAFYPGAAAIAAAVREILTPA